jgi:hypothetical protein
MRVLGNSDSDTSRLARALEFGIDHRVQGRLVPGQLHIQPARVARTANDHELSSDG